MASPLATCRLQAHPQTPCTIVDEVVVDVEVADGSLALRYRIVGELHRLRIPARGESLDPERLWAHTCCELFVAPAGAEGYPQRDRAYVEWNFSPSGQVARFEFSGYRRRVASGSNDGERPKASVHGRELRLEARVPRPPSDARMALTAVIEDAGGGLSYWALRHPSGKPDFHHADGFALALTLGPPLAIVTP